MCTYEACRRERVGGGAWRGPRGLKINSNHQSKRTPEFNFTITRASGLRPPLALPDIPSLLETAKGELKDKDEVLIPVCAKIWDVTDDKNLCRRTGPLAITSLS